MRWRTGLPLWVALTCFFRTLVSVPGYQTLFLALLSLVYILRTCLLFLVITRDVIKIGWGGNRPGENSGCADLWCCCEQAQSRYLHAFAGEKEGCLFDPSDSRVRSSSTGQSLVSDQEQECPLISAVAVFAAAFSGPSMLDGCPVVPYAGYRCVRFLDHRLSE